jgi:2-polyprenyl-6-methoxyphenol hydroxylase-like FAD-dependent oxidoreductase
MSPVGGVGINLAIHDAVAAANILSGPLLAGSVPESLLAEVQRRLEWPTRMTQRLQLLIQNAVVSNVLQLKQQPTLPRVAKPLWFPVLRRFPPRLIWASRPEHVSPENRIQKSERKFRILNFPTS